MTSVQDTLPHTRIASHITKFSLQPAVPSNNNKKKENKENKIEKKFNILCENHLLTPNLIQSALAFGCINFIIIKDDGGEADDDNVEQKSTKEEEEEDHKTNHRHPTDTLKYVNSYKDAKGLVQKENIFVGICLFPKLDTIDKTYKIFSLKELSTIGENIEKNNDEKPVDEQSARRQILVTFVFLESFYAVQQQICDVYVHIPGVSNSFRLPTEIYASIAFQSFMSSD